MIPRTIKLMGSHTRCFPCKTGRQSVKLSSREVEERDTKSRCFVMFLKILSDVNCRFLESDCVTSFFFHQIRSKYSRTSMARTSLGPWKFVRDMGSSSH